MLRIAEQFITTYMKDVQSVLLSYFQFLNATLHYTYLRQLCLSKLYQTPSIFIVLHSVCQVHHLQVHLNNRLSLECGHSL